MSRAHECKVVNFCFMLFVEKHVEYFQRIPLPDLSFIVLPYCAWHWIMFKNRNFAINYAYFITCFQIVKICLIRSFIMAKLRVDEGVTAMKFPASRGNQAGREFYVMMCDFGTILSHFKFDTDPAIPANLRAQRKIRDSRIPKITSYILENPDNYIFSAITVSVDKKITFEPEPPNNSESKIGHITIPSNAKILVNDGQHRCAAIRSACEQNEQIGSERIAVVVFEDRGLKRSQQMFADLNKHAVKPTKSLGLLYDHRDTYARFIVNLAKDLDIFYNRTEMEKTNISNRSTNLFTLNGIADATRHLLRLKTKSISPEKQKLAAEYWDRISKNIPEWNLLMEDKIKSVELRKDYVHAHTNIHNALGLVGYILTQRSDWRERMKKMQKIDWKKSNTVWQDKVVMDGKMLKNRLGIKRAANEILAQLGVSDRVESSV